MTWTANCTNCGWNGTVESDVEPKDCDWCDKAGALMSWPNEEEAKA